MKMIKELMIGLIAIGGLLPLTAMAETNSKVPEMSDTLIQTKLSTTYMLNRHLNAYDINVDVRDQVAHLSGAVATPVQKDLAGELAKSIVGVRSVDNEIAVGKDTKRRVASNATDRSFGQVVSDLTTTASIKSKFLIDQNIAGLKIDVDTMNDRVTLSGAVKSDTEKQLAEQIAKNTDGVTSVESRLTINPKA